MQRIKEKKVSRWTWKQKEKDERGSRRKKDRDEKERGRREHSLQARHSKCAPLREVQLASMDLPDRWNTRTTFGQERSNDSTTVENVPSALVF